MIPFNSWDTCCKYHFPHFRSKDTVIPGNCKLERFQGHSFYWKWDSYSTSSEQKVTCLHKGQQKVAKTQGYWPSEHNIYIKWKLLTTCKRKNRPKPREKKQCHQQLLMSFGLSLVGHRNAETNPLKASFQITNLILLVMRFMPAFYHHLFI